MHRAIWLLRHFLALAILAAFSAAVSAEPVVGPNPTFAPAVPRLEAFIEHEVAAKGLPALSIALVDDQTVVWARGFGLADPQAGKKATADTVYRVGSVSKLFTDLAVMQLVERGALDLDAPVTKVLPDFKPVNPFDKAITLRQLMSHRSGLVREPPVGNYFDPTRPSLARTVESLNKTEVVYRPESRIKYSNAAVATAGFVLEQTQKQTFERYLQRTVLTHLGMDRSSFGPEMIIRGREVAKGLMWTYHGREFPAPTFENGIWPAEPFEMGMAPAVSLYSTVNDLARFLSMLFAGGKGAGGVLVRSETLEEMYRPQFAPQRTKDGFGIGFMVSELEGRRRVGHGGAVYGFATELAALPDDKLGVVVIASRDVCNAVTTRIADEALKQMLAVRRGKPLPAIAETAPLEPGLARRLAGRYRSGDETLDLDEREGRLFAMRGEGGYRVEVRSQGKALVADDRVLYGPRLEIEGTKLKTGGRVWERAKETIPPAVPEKWRGLIGEYGPDYDTLYILERDGKLQALIEWFFLYPLEEVRPDVYRFPDFGLYEGERIVFTRGPGGKAKSAVAAGVVFERRPIDGEDGATFKITALRPVDELRREALAARPPVEQGEFRQSDLVELVALDKTIKLDIRYASTNNFLSTPFYTQARAFMQRPAAEALVRVHKKLEAQGYGLLVFDGYRPWSVTKMFWEATPRQSRVFVADPAKGSRHNRGCAVDLTLFDLKNGKPVEMVGGYDEFSDRSYAAYQGGTSRQRYYRELLRRAMEDEGFSVYEAEWWHFDYKDWKKYAIGNLTFEEVDRQNRERRRP
jgi:serine beta-lactamase-like protein LACTB